VEESRCLPHGSWPSPISASSLVEGTSTIIEMVVDEDDIWWSESRPDEGGRIAIMRGIPNATPQEITPNEINVRSKVHEYGGGAWWVDKQSLYCVNFGDQRLRRIYPDGQVELLTPEPPEDQIWRFADGRVTPNGEWFICIREIHHHFDDGVVVEPDNQIVAVATDGSCEIRELVVGADFYAFPRLSPDGEFLAWIQWLHPSMPWYETELWVGRLADGQIVNAKKLEGADEESVSQPEWSEGSDLYFLSDRSGWSNLYRFTEEGSELVIGGMFDIGGPLWVLGQSRYAISPSGEAIVASSNSSGDVLVQNTPANELLRSATINVVRCSASGLPVVVASTHQAGSSIIRYAKEHELIHSAEPHGLAREYFPTPDLISFPTLDGREAYGYFYAPAHPNYNGPENEIPPLLVLAHGGPTGSARYELNLALRYWTSRGWAVVDVDYRGSTGYGRSYMEALDGEWGVIDVEDCVAAARYLVSEGHVDPERLAIKGGSAGGFTVLAALAFYDDFSAGSSRYGVADLEILARDTHKFESRYLDRLIGPYPEQRDTYLDRSPINHTEKFDSPMLILQGTEDAVVPQNQAELIVSALAENKIPHSYLLFEGEGHGFRKAENIITALEGEYSFFAQIFNFKPADEIPTILIRKGL